MKTCSALLTIFLILPFVFAQELKPGSVYIIGRPKILSIQTSAGLKKYFLVTETSPLKVKIKGPAIIRVDFRKNIQPNVPDSKKQITLTIYRNNELYKRVNVTPQDSFTDIYEETATLLPSEPNIFELFVPPDESTFTFSLSPTSVGGGAINFTLKELIVKKKMPEAKERKKEVGVSKVVERKAGKRTIGVSAGAGYIMSRGYLSDPLYLIELGYFLPFHLQPMILSLEAGYYSSRSNETRSSEILGDLNVNFTLRVVPVTFNILYSVPFNLPLRPYLGGGVGVFNSILSYNYDSPPHGEGRTQEANFGFTVRMGTTYEIKPGELMAELRFISSKLSGSGSTSGNVGGSSFMLGYRFVF